MSPSVKQINQTYQRKRVSSSEKTTENPSVSEKISVQILKKMSKIL